MKVSVIKRRPAGFTVIELLIATVIFSLILLLITAAVLQFSRQYYRGVVASSTQNTVRSLVDDITRSVEFNSGTVYGSSASGFYCVGSSKRYSFKLYHEVSTTSHGLVSDTVSACGSSTGRIAVESTSNLTTPNARELLGKNMRISKFDITPSGDLYTITVKVVYGDDDVLNNPNTSAANCKANIGFSYCAVSEVSTIVKKRVN